MDEAELRKPIEFVAVLAQAMSAPKRARFSQLGHIVGLGYVTDSALSRILAAMDNHGLLAAGIKGGFAP